MSLAWLQSYIEATFPSACVPVDLLKIARTQSYPNPSSRSEFGFSYEYHQDFYYPAPHCLVIDGECCLSRLYGGFFGDWACGGQWNRMVDHLSTLIQVLVTNNIEVTVFFNGASEPHRHDKWLEKQRSDKEKISQVLRHVSVKGTPPPKVWWVPPNALRSCLRMALRHLNVNVVMSTTDHRQDVMNFVRKHHCHGLIAEDSEYLVLDPPKLYSAENLKLTYKGCLETKEYVMNEVTRCLNLHPSRICIVASLLGNHIITETDLAIFHHTLGSEEKGKVPPNKLIEAVVDFVRNIPSVDDLDIVANLAFGKDQDKTERFKRCVLYYARGNKNANRFHTNGPGQTMGGSTSVTLFTDHSSSENDVQSSQTKPQRSPLLPTPKGQRDPNAGLQNQNMVDIASNSNVGPIGQPKEELVGIKEMPKFASETIEMERSSLQAYREVLSKVNKHGSSSIYHILSHQEDRSCDDLITFNDDPGDNCTSNHKDFPPDAASNCDLSSVESSVAPMSLNVKSKKNQKLSFSKPNYDAPLLPKVSAEVFRVARDRHQRGLMNPAIFQLLSQGELKLPTTFEDETGRDLPSVVLLFRPIRQMVYALLFNHHHLKYLAEQKKEKDGINEKPCEIIVKEWVCTRTNRFNRADLVPSLPLGWAVPTVTRLWFGSGPEENKRRVQAFLTCLRSNTSLMRNTNYVPQHCLIMCCVLRYIMTNPDGPVFRKQELDAFLVQSADPLLTDVNETQKLELPLVTTRGIHLAAIFMTGVENALIANDACGAPVPWLMCCPWLFFDGKLFHRMLLKANAAKNLIDLCDNRLEEVAKVERMRTAILEGINQVQYAHTPLTSVNPRPPPFHNFPVPGIGRGRGHQRVVPRGGQLEVAGVVVGSWGPNYGQGPRSPSRNIPPQVVSVGGATRGRASPMVNIPRGPIMRPILSNKSNSTSRKTVTRPETSIIADVLPSENLTLFRATGRNCTSDNRESHDFTNLNQAVQSDNIDSASHWESAYRCEKEQ